MANSICLDPMRKNHLEQILPDQSILVHGLEKRLSALYERIERTFESASLQMKEFSVRSSEISRMSLSAAKVMGGDEIQGAIEGLRRMVENLRALFLETDTRNDGNLDLLKKIHTNLDRVERDLEDLLDTSNSLRMLGLSTKIQSTRTGRSMSTFMQLGEDISSMSGVILGKAEELIHQGGELSDLLRNVFKDLAALKTRQSRQTRGVLNGTLQVIGSLEDISKNSQDEATRIAHWAGEIEKSLHEVVAAIRFKDAARRDIEKIKESIAGIQGGAMPHVEAGGVPCDYRILAAVEFRRQARSLRDIEGELARAVGRIVEGFGGIQVNIADISQVTGKSCEASSRFCEQLEKGIHSVTSFLSEVVESGHQVSSSMKSLSVTVEGMSAFTRDIENISSDVELISINARIKAAQTGERGAGMGVIAGAVQRTASASNGYRESFIEKLQAIRQLAGSLQTAMETASRREESKLDTAVRDLGVFLDALRIMQERIIATYRSMEEKGRSLSESISLLSGAMRQFKDEQVLAEDLSRHLEGIAHHVASQVPSTEFALMGVGEPAEGSVEQSVDDRLRLIEERLNGGPDGKA